MMKQTLTWLCCFMLWLSAAAAAPDSGSDGNSSNEKPDLPTSPPFYPSPLTGRLKDTTWSEAVQRARDLVNQMTLVEKVNLTTGIGFPMGRCSGSTGSVPRFDIPQICVQDGPLGVGSTDFVTSFPPGLSVATSFNKDLAYRRGQAIGQEFRKKGVHVMLGPCIGPIGAVALGGRNWESFGSDPYLQGVAGALTVEGVQEQGIMTNIKHLIGNEQEQYRNVDEAREHGWGNLPEVLSSNIDDRTMHEIYLWPFAEAIHAGAASIMCSYNQLNNSYGCQNSHVLNGLAKEELGFQGFIMSDWGATHSGAGAMLAGLDMNMPGPGGNIATSDWSLWGANMTNMVLNGTVPEWRVDDMATRILSAYYFVGVDKTYEVGEEPNFYMSSLDDVGNMYKGFGGEQVLNKHVNAISKQSRQVAYQGAVESFVLLKNKNNTLPLKAKNKELPRKVGILGLAAMPSPDGPNCDRQMCSDGALGTGWGSGAVEFPYFVTPYDAINRRGIEEGMSVLSTTGADAVYANDSVLNTTNFYDIAKHTDINFVFGLSNSGEGFGLVANNSYGDRTNYSLWHGADELIEKAVKLNKNNVIVATTVGPIDMERWIDHENVTAVLLNTPTGQDFGDALVEILFGEQNPSGRLPFTIAKDSKDYIPVYNKWKNGSDWAPQDDFSSGVFIDYRHFEKNNIEPRFEFGYGLSYSNWTVKDLEIYQEFSPPEYMPKANALEPAQINKDEKLPDISEVKAPEGATLIPHYMYPYIDQVNKTDGEYPYPEGYSDEHPEEQVFATAGGGIGGNPELWKSAYKVRAAVSNEGPYYGSYVLQLYVGFPDSDEYPSPAKQLRGFEKVTIGEGGYTKVEFDLKVRDLAVWDVNTQGWRVQRGEYKIYVGSSSRNLELQDTIKIE